jgi:FkbM family methyltransferase
MDLVKGRVHLGPVTRDFWYRPDSSDGPVVQQIFVREEYNLDHLARYPELKAYYERKSARGQRGLIIDGGANIGASSVAFALGWPRSMITAIEPDTGNFKLLMANTGGLPITCVHGALSASPGKARVVDIGRGEWAYQTRRVADAEHEDDAIPCVTIDEIYRDNAKRCFPFIVKIDIEGAEADVFAANTDWVAATPLILIEPHDWLMPRGGTSRGFLKCIAEQDRDFLIIGENICSISNQLAEL